MHNRRVEYHSAKRKHELCYGDISALYLSPTRSAGSKPQRTAVEEGSLPSHWLDTRSSSRSLPQIKRYRSVTDLASSITSFFSCHPAPWRGDPVSLRCRSRGNSLAPGIGRCQLERSCQKCAAQRSGCRRSGTEGADRIDPGHTRAITGTQTALISGMEWARSPGQRNAHTGAATRGAPKTEAGRLDEIVSLLLDRRP